MRELTLNKCLNGLDKIMYGKVEDDSKLIIVKILNDLRIYIIDSTRENVINTDREKIFMITLQFINYMIQEILLGSLTNQYLNHCNALRSLVLKLISGIEFYIDKEIDFDEECNSFINDYIIDDDDGEEEDADKSKEELLLQANSKSKKKVLTKSK